MTNCRTTKQKQLVLQVAQSHHDHPTADTIYLEVRAIDNRISRGTVYRNLEKFCESGHLLRVKLPGADRYDSTLNYHYHMICTNCNNVYDAPIAYQRDIDAMISQQSGFKVARHRTLFEGICPACAEKSLKGDNNKDQKN